MTEKARIWELDALRGLCILGMVAVHFVYDLVELYALVDWQYPPLFSLIKNWGGIVFLLISGICATLGSRPVRRGGIVLACGVVCFAVTLAMYRLGLADGSILIWFGVLHCLGVCMLLWPLADRLPTPALAAVGLLLAAAGLVLRHATVSFPYLIFLGLVPEGFASSDFFPLLPNLGFFLLGAVVGRTAYRQRRTLLPRVNAHAPVLSFLQLCGKHSLLIYLLHQPVLAGILGLVSLAHA